MKYVGNFGRTLDLGHIMNICEHGHAHFVLNIFQDLQTGFHPKAAKALDRRSIRFIKGSFENKAESDIARARGTLARHHQRVLLGFDYAGPGDNC